MDTKLTDDLRPPHLTSSSSPPPSSRRHARVLFPLPDRSLLIQFRRHNRLKFDVRGMRWTSALYIPLSFPPPRRALRLLLPAHLVLSHRLDLDDPVSLLLLLLWWWWWWWWWWWLWLWLLMLSRRLAVGITKRVFVYFLSRSWFHFSLCDAFKLRFWWLDVGTGRSHAGCSTIGGGDETDSLAGTSWILSSVVA